MVTVRAPLALPSIDEVLEMMQQAFGAYRAVIADLNETNDQTHGRTCAHVLSNLKTTGASNRIELAIGSGAKAP